MAVTHEDRLTTPAKIAGALGIGFGLFAGAGVTGLSLLIGIFGLWGLVYGLTATGRPLLGAMGRSLAHHWLVWLLFAGFVGWVLFTATWSPATKLAGESVRRIGTMAMLIPIAAWAASSRDPCDQLIAHRGLLAGLAIAFVILVFEAATNASANQIASPEKDRLAIDGDLGRAATATLALFWAGVVALRRQFDQRHVIGGFVLLGGVISLQFGTDLNSVGIVLGSVAALFAAAFPRVALGILSGACATIMMSAPVLYPLITKAALHFAPGGQLPLSYGRRAQMWQVASDLITQKPLTGWGLGAGSTFDKVIRFGGYDWPLIQLHPHSAPLHIWLETGAVGATLASLTIVAAGVAAMTAFRRDKGACAALVGGLTFLAINWAFSHAAWREWMWTSFAAVVIFALNLRQQQRARGSKAAGL
jgi:O-antigen ligase